MLISLARFWNSKKFSSYKQKMHRNFVLDIQIDKPNLFLKVWTQPYLFCVQNNELQF